MGHTCKLSQTEKLFKGVKKISIGTLRKCSVCWYETMDLQEKLMNKIRSKGNYYNYEYEPSNIDLKLGSGPPGTTFVTSISWDDFDARGAWLDELSARIYKGRVAQR